MEKFEKELYSSSIVRFQDCDPFGHLNNARYMDYFLNAREDQLIKSYSFDIYKIAKETGKSWVVSKNEIVYLKPAFLMEPVQIKTSMIGFSHNSLQLEGVMYNADFSQIKSVLWIKFIHVSLKEGKSILHDEELMKFFSNVQIDRPEIERKVFDERVGQILKEFKMTASVQK